MEIERVVVGSYERTTYPDTTKTQVGEEIAGVIDVFHKHSIDVRLTGSYGRAASIRVEPPARYTRDCELRDIDFMVVHHDRKKPSIDAVTQEAKIVIDSPVYVDVLRDNALFSNGNTADIQYRKIQVEVDPRVFSMEQGKIYDCEVPTFDPMTHFHLSGVHGHMRKKDLRNLITFGRQIRDLPTLPDEMFEPFHELFKHIETTYPLEKPIFALTEWYREYIPYEMRKIMLPIMQPLKEVLLPKQ